MSCLPDETLYFITRAAKWFAHCFFSHSFSNRNCVFVSSSVLHFQILYKIVIVECCTLHEYSEKEEFPKAKM